MHESAIACQPLNTDGEVAGNPRELSRVVVQQCLNDRSMDVVDPRWEETDIDVRVGTLGRASYY